MHAAFPRKHAAPGWPLLATLGVHLVLAWSWRVAYPPAPGLGEERVIDLVRVAPPAPQLRRLPPPSPPRTSTPSTPRTRPGGAPAAAIPAAEPEPESSTPAPEAAPAAADPFVISAPSAPAQSALEAMDGRAKRDAVLIDRELRKGKPGVPEVADTPMGRFRQALEAAHKDSRRGLTSETYTAPDGEVIYRFRQGGKVWCRTGGSVRPQIGGAVGGGATLFDSGGGGGAAGLIGCPSHGDWKRD